MNQGQPSESFINQPADTLENTSIDVAYTDDDDETGLVPAIPASTLVVMRERGDAPPQLLMVRRAATMRFAAGALVFPGGRVDEDDRLIAVDAGLIGDQAVLQPDPPSIAESAARIGAIRETIEETGLAVGVLQHGMPLTDSDEIAGMRRDLLADRPFSDLLRAHNLHLDLAALLPFSRWRPNFAHTRVFDTRFYIAKVGDPNDANLNRLTVAESENSALLWADAHSLLVGVERGEHHVIFPTLRNLERLALFPDYAAASESTRQFPSRRITPFLADEGGERFLCIREDCGYPVTRESFSSAMRG
jgi:8-oxo-dGTP pyrophosphatase MutT (NUDIX family)